ncbi:ABC transporter ATP-binding protein [Sulfurimonas paralvinellae]|uniref:Cell division ATP-binding protein FtsE n=1 Tax=Sulfurimonas paralvinellae TaxID=317658 RepID=A0A7M1B8G1_9BACT|nr:ABC transporter ATP-binding protein [Sulfurimonas paralvinellae]QOP45994.1 ABC transporter ATP-binding protein [Sulfurimonas paralvinellae]
MIRLKNITKIYDGNVHALNNINLTFKEGELVILKGMSGSGKSTILSLIAGLSKPTEGEVFVDSKKISKLPDHFAATYRRDNIGIVFQKYNLIPTLSVKENVLLPLFPLNLPRELMDQKAAAVLGKFHIEQKIDMMVKNLSGGEQQRVAIARANINDPKIILADEPTANLDEKLSLEFIEMLRDLKSKKRTIVVATHDPLFFDLDFVDTIVNIEHGNLL